MTAGTGHFFVNVMVRLETIAMLLLVVKTAALGKGFRASLKKLMESVLGLSTPWRVYVLAVPVLLVCAHGERLGLDAAKSAFYSCWSGAARGMVEGDWRNAWHRFPIARLAGSYCSVLEGYGHLPSTSRNGEGDAPRAWRALARSPLRASKSVPEPPPRRSSVGIMSPDAVQTPCNGPFPS